MNLNMRFAITMLPIVIVLSSIFLNPSQYVDHVWPLLSWIYSPGIAILLLFEPSSFHSLTTIVIFVSNLILYALVAYAGIAGLAAWKETR